MPQEMNFRVHFHLGEACVVEIMFWFFVTINEQTTSEKTMYPYFSQEVPPVLMTFNILVRGNLGEYWLSFKFFQKGAQVVTRYLVTIPNKTELP